MLSKKYKILIIDDEQSGRKALQLLLEKYFWPYTEKINIAKSFDDAKSKIGETEYDLIFLDINLKGYSGFDLLQFLSPASTLVFVTAYSEYTIQALRAKAFDYLIKPLNPVELRQCLDRILQERQQLQKVQKLVIRNRGLSKFIYLSSILYIEGDGPYATIFCTDEPIKVSKTLKSILPELGDGFVRIHKSYIVNRDFVKGFKHDKVFLVNNKSLPVSRTGIKILTS